MSKTYRNISVASLVLAGLAVLATPASAAPIRMFVSHGGGDVGAAHGGEIGVIDQTTYGYTAIGDYGNGVTGLASDGTLLYASLNTGNLLTIDPDTGAVLHTAVPAQVFQDLGYDPTTGTFYGTSTGHQLFEIDMVTGATSLISSTAAWMGGGYKSIEFGTDGTLYTSASYEAKVATIDPSNGAVISSVANGVPGGVIGLGFDPVTGMLVAGECCGGPDGSNIERLYSIDPASGVATLLHDFNDGRRMHDFAFVGELAPQPVPEPSTLALLGAGLLVAARQYRKRRS
jgi:hypothetical protein